MQWLLRLKVIRTSITSYSPLEKAQVRHEKSLLGKFSRHKTTLLLRAKTNHRYHIMFFAQRYIIYTSDRHYIEERSQNIMNWDRSSNHLSKPRTLRVTCKHIKLLRNHINKEHACISSLHYPKMSTRKDILLQYKYIRTSQIKTQISLDEVWIWNLTKFVLISLTFQIETYFRWRGWLLKCYNWVCNNSRGTCICHIRLNIFNGATMYRLGCRVHMKFNSYHNTF